MSKKKYRLTIIRHYIASYVEIEANSEHEAKCKYIDEEWIETGSDEFNDVFMLEHEEILECEELR